MRTDPIHHQRKQQKHKPVAQITELAGFCDLCGTGCHWLMSV
jgi:hypothetical protein